MSSRNNKAKERKGQANPSANNTPQGSGVPGRWVRYRWLFKLVAICLPLLALLVLEVGLRIGGFGYPTGFFIEKEIQGKRKLLDNRQFLWRFFPPSMARTPDPIIVDAVKPPDVVRVVVLGESAAMGDPEPVYGFARMLEVLLREAYPDKKVEVINAACTAINSHAIVDIARGCGKLRPDFYVVYMGNNEVVGPYGAGTVFGIPGASLELIRASLWAKKLKLAQLLATLSNNSSAAKQKWAGMEMFLDKRIRQNDPKMKRVYDAFRRNTQDILAEGKKAGAKTVVCTVAANLKDCPPFASLHRAGFNEEKAWDEKVKAGADLAAAGRHVEALKEFEAALKLDGEFAELHYRIGQSQLALGRADEARKSFQQALELDALRFRADSQINKILREAASGRTKDGIYLLDTEAMLSAKNAIPGNELFWEHVHFNFAGNYQMARRVADELARLWPGANTPSEVKTNWLSMDETGRRLAYVDWNRLKILQDVQKRFTHPPFTMQLGHSQQMEEITKQVQDLQKGMGEESLQTQIAECRKAVAAWPENWRLVANLGTLLQQAGNFPEAATQWRQVVELLPHHGGAYFSCGQALYAQGKIEEAMEWHSRVLTLKPDSPEVWNELSICYLSLNRMDEALSYCQRAVKRDPEEQSYHYNLGIILAKQGKTENAVKEYRRALELDPSYASAAINLANLLSNTGDFKGAEEVFKAFIERVPEDVQIRYNYGSMLAQQGRFSEALAQIQVVLQRKPNHVEARYNLGKIYMSQQRYQEAVAEFEQIQMLRPNWPLGQQALELAHRKQQEQGPPRTN